jgi:SAM-dependent methyltransferase
VSEYDVFARFYDLDTAESNADLPFWLNLARRTGGPILEVACGTGRILLPLARAGFEIVGVDISPAMLAIARRKFADADMASRVQLVEANALDLNLERRFSLAIVALNSFGHFLGEGEPERAVERIHHHLRPGAIVALDLTNPVPGAFGETTGVVIHDYTREGPETGFVTVKTRSQTLDPIEQIVDVSCFYDEVGPGGAVRRTLAEFGLRYFYRNELRLLFERTGFTLEATYGSYELEPLREESERLIAIGRRE